MSFASRLALPLVLLLALLAAGCERQPPGATQAALRAAVGADPVVLLSAAWCGYCRRLRGDLDRWGIDYREYDVERSARGRKALAILPGAGVPILLVGDERVQGYMPERTRRMLRSQGLWSATATP